MKKLLLLLILSGCSLFPPKPSNEMEVMEKDVLKAKQGIEIQIFPIPKDKK